ncbi:metallophosphoesterase [Helicobacter cappadocius]|uniref:Metallophosphoesterase n=1 Tax=Helicobacter cappadocius TaxID=3063998 RepID=A0AA90TF79_9HELI|nr:MULTISPECIES: metallophosphoesterase [unclassified Helicobacter]MDO7253391.1 metallophosphoesterase [Helicobacter sp. faydin-H75]MDP2539345.1 metallophosphoesterase [Helicobacter sp. faydin-H76]
MKNISTYPEIKDDAFFISDSHYIRGDNTLPQLLEKLIASPPVQVFFMGDIFHLLIGHIPSSRKENAFLLQLINELSEKCEVFYFEGNHDFGIDSFLLPKVKIYPRSLQPASFCYKQKHFLLAHGDIFLTTTYNAYIQALTNPFCLSILKILDGLSLGFIYKFISKKIYKKPILRFKLNDKDFEKFANNRIDKYLNFIKKHRFEPIEGIIEGHFHIGKNFQNYFSLPSFYCEKSGFVIQSSKYNGMDI